MSVVPSQQRLSIQLGNVTEVSCETLLDGMMIIGNIGVTRLVSDPSLFNEIVNFVSALATGNNSLE